LNDISADSSTGADGTVDFPQVQPERRTSVPLEPVLASEDSIDRSCAVRPSPRSFEQPEEPLEDSAGQELGKQPKQKPAQQPEEQFIISGRGGIPPSPKEALSAQQQPLAWMTLPNQTGANDATRFVAPSTQIEPLLPEASTWRQQSDGRIQLVSAFSIAASPMAAAKTACLKSLLP